MDADRSRRDELESLQMEARALRAELALPHSPGFPEKKAEHERLGREAFEREAQAVAARNRARHERATLESRVLALRERLRIAQQERLGLVMLAVLPSLGAVLWSMQFLRHEARLVALACAAVLGFVLGPRLARWVRGDTRGSLSQLGSVATDATVRNVGLLPFGLALAATLGPFFVRDWTLFRGTGGTFLAMHLELLVASLAVLAARRGERLADEGRGVHRGLATAGGVLAFLPLLALFTVGAVALRDVGSLESWAGWVGRPLVELRGSAEGLALLAPAALLLPWRLDGLRRREARRPWAWAFAALWGTFALFCALGALGTMRLYESSARGWRDEWVLPYWHEWALAAWSAAGAWLWLDRARDARRARRGG